MASTAQGQGFDVHHLRPNPDLTEPYFNSASAHTHVAGDYSVGVLVDFAKNPLVLYDNDGKRAASLVERQLTGTLAGSVALTQRLTIGLAVPVVLDQAGDTVSYLASAPNAGVGMGDIRVMPRFVLIGGKGEPRKPRGFALAMAVDVSIPTGSRTDYQGEGIGAEPKVMAEWVLPSALRFVASLGYAIRPKAELVDLTINDMVTWTVATAYPVTERLTLTGEVRGAASVLASHIGTAELPVEVLVGGKHRTLPFMTLMAGGGVGVIQGAGAPDYRLFVGAALHNVRSEQPVAKDSDGDGLLDTQDACPFNPEDKDAFADTDGCPEPDNDADGILDTNDSCPNVPEDKDAFADENGCPDPDNDSDGILDTADSCPNDPEDKDAFADENGCPDPDNDSDGILDISDVCPLEPETVNGVNDTDGCPDQADKVHLSCTKIDMAENVFFDTGKSTIQARSFPLLDKVAALLRDTPAVKKIRIEGHTDDRGADATNLKLSHARALAVRRYLVKHGVEPGRLDAEGFGETRPIATNDNNPGREQNRRVELVVTEHDGQNCTESKPSAAVSHEVMARLKHRRSLMAR